VSENKKPHSKWALLVGIDKYPLLAPRGQLAGCVNDVRLLSSLLLKFGFPKENICHLENERATRDDILNALRELAGKISENDAVVVHFSGLGSMMTDREGDEPDGLDETIVPFDGGRAPYENRDITEDELYVFIKGISQKTTNITLIFDTSHSGSIFRDASLSNSRWLEPDLRPVEQLPPSPILGVSLPRDSGPSGWLPISEGYVVIAACQSNGSCYEHASLLDGQIAIYGALTYFLACELILAPSGCTYREVFHGIYLGITTNYPSQVPQIEGPLDHQLFGVHEPVRIALPQVGQRDRDVVTLDVGTLHGVTKGSLWGIYRSSEIDNPRSKLGLVEIEGIGLINSHARILAESDQAAITVGSLAFEEAHFFGEMRLFVKLRIDSGYEQEGVELEEVVERSRMLSMTTEAQGADAEVYLLAPREKPLIGAPVPQLGSIHAPIWVVVARDGELLIPPISASQRGAVHQIGDFLERYGRYRFALRLRNQNIESKLAGLVDFDLLRRTSEGSWQVARAENATAYPVFREGDSIAFRIYNRSLLPIFLTVIDFGVTWRLLPVYPPPGAYEALSPGTQVDFGTRSGEEIELFLPNEFSVPGRWGELRDGRVEVLKLIATAYPVDFTVLFMQGVIREARDPFGAATQLGQLLDTALTGYGKREVRSTAVPEEQDWATIERPFLLCPGSDERARG
jgi:hypothetical protein